MFADKCDQPDGGRFVIGGQLQFINRQQLDVISGTGNRIDAKRKLRIVGMPVHRIGENAADLRCRHATADQSGDVIAHLRKAFIALDCDPQIRLVFDRRRADEIVDEPVGDASFGKPDFGAGFRAFAVMIDPRLVVLVGKYEAKARMKFTAQNGFDAPGLAKLAAASDRFSSLRNIFIHEAAL